MSTKLSPYGRGPDRRRRRSYRLLPDVLVKLEDLSKQHGASMASEIEEAVSDRHAKMLRDAKKTA